MAITSTGLGSGLDIEGLVKQLVSAERAPQETKITKQGAAATAKLTGLGTLRGALSAFQTTARTLSTTSQFLQLSVSSSDSSSVVGSANTSTTMGSHVVEVSQLAQNQRLKTAAYSSINDVIGTGSLIIDFGTIADSGGSPLTTDSNGHYTGASFTRNSTKPSATINIDAQHNTVGGIRDAINAAGIGVTASVVNDGTGVRLVLSSNDAGASNSLRILTADDDGTSTNTSGLSQLAFDATLGASAGQNLSEAQNAQSAKFKVDSIAVTSESNSPSGVISGLSLNLLKVTTTPVIISTGRDTTATSKSIDAFVKAYNDLRSNLHDLTYFDPATKKAGVLQGDSVASSVEYKLRGVMNAVHEGGTFTRLSDVGITLQKDGTMVYDSSKFNAAVAKDSASVAGLFGSYGVSTDSQVQYYSASSTALAGSYPISITQMATQASLTAGASLATPSFVVDANNDNFKIKVDGVETGSITLTAGTYTPAQMVTELQTQIDADATLGAGKVTVAYDSNAHKLTFTSTSTGTNSKVAITQVDTNSATTLGLNVSTGSTGSVGTSGSLSAYTPVTIDANNDSLQVIVDGVSSGVISLRQATYSSAGDLANEIQGKINGSSTLKGAGASVSVKFDETTGKFIINSSRYGTKSTVQISAVDTNTTATLGLSAATGTAGLDVAGSIGGASGVGDGQILSGGGNAYGLKVLVTGGSAGSRGSLSFNRGFALQLDQAVDSMLNTDGVLTSRVNGLNQSLKDLDAQFTKLDTRMADVEKRYRAQFTALDTLVAGLKQTSAYLTQQLSALSNSR